MKRCHDAKSIVGHDQHRRVDTPEKNWENYTLRLTGLKVLVGLDWTAASNDVVPSSCAAFVKGQGRRGPDAASYKIKHATAPIDSGDRTG